MDGLSSGRYCSSFVFSHTCPHCPLVPRYVSKAVGATKGNTGVSSSGGATCSILIEIPNGTNGVQPELNLVYNSQSGAGLAGNGWNITGISSISRAGKTDYYSGITTPVNYTNANDAFCLNGMRMFPITGTNGSDGTVYGAENEGYAKIESFGGSAAPYLHQL